MKVEVYDYVMPEILMELLCFIQGGFVGIPCKGWRPFFLGGEEEGENNSIILLIYDMIYDMMYHQNYMECLTVVQVVKVDQASQDKCSCCC